MKRILFGVAFALVCGAAAAGPMCPGKPDALGVSRELVVGAGEYFRLGKMQYRQTLPLADREVVLTFDDGPLPHYSDRVLDILAAQCVKATFFELRSTHQFDDLIDANGSDGGPVRPSARAVLRLTIALGNSSSPPSGERRKISATNPAPFLPDRAGTACDAAGPP